MDRHLTGNQIQQLYTFTERRYVEWYDVQTELVDHLANGIESQWQTNPSISFEHALTNEFKKFGLFGFQDLVEEKGKALNKYYRKQVWFYLKEFFTLPKIILTLFLVWALFSLIHFLDDKEPLMSVLVCVIIAAHIFHLVRFKISIRKRKKKTGRKWLFENNIIQLGGLNLFLIVGISFQNSFTSFKQWTSASEFMFSIAIILYLLIFYISIIIIPKKLKLKMSKEHPEYYFI